MAEFILETVTPVHIGTGSKYSGAEFVLKDGKLYRVSIDKLLKKMILLFLGELLYILGMMAKKYLLIFAIFLKWKVV